MVDEAARLGVGNTCMSFSPNIVFEGKIVGEPASSFDQERVLTGDTALHTIPGSKSRGSIGPRRSEVSGSGLAKTSASASRSTSIGNLEHIHSPY